MSKAGVPTRANTGASLRFADAVVDRRVEAPECSVDGIGPTPTRTRPGAYAHRARSPMPSRPGRSTLPPDTRRRRTCPWHNSSPPEPRLCAPTTPPTSSCSRSPRWSGTCSSDSSPASGSPSSTSRPWSAGPQARSATPCASGIRTGCGGCATATAGSTCWCCWSSSPPSTAPWRCGC